LSSRMNGTVPAEGVSEPTHGPTMDIPKQMDKTIRQRLGILHL
jgi:hypothetical protein